MVKIILSISLIISFIVIFLLSIILRKKNKELNNTKQNRNIHQKRYNIPNKGNCNNCDNISNLVKINGLLYGKLANLGEILLFITEELSSNTERIETSTIQIIEKLSDISSRNIEQYVEFASNIIYTIKNKLEVFYENKKKSNNDIDYISKGYGDIIDNISNELELIIKENIRDVESLKEVSDKMQEIIPFSLYIYDLANKSKILSLNSRIESSRLGASEKIGNIFKVIGNEIERLSSGISGYAEKIETKIRDINENIEETLDFFENSKQAESHFIKSTIVVIKEIFMSMVDSLIELKKIVDNMVQITIVMREDMNEIILKLQFEDVTRQKSIKIIENLTKIVGYINEVNVYHKIEKLNIPENLKNIFKDEIDKQERYIEENIKNKLHIDIEHLKNKNDYNENKDSNEGEDVVFF